MNVSCIGACKKEIISSVAYGCFVSILYRITRQLDNTIDNIEYQLVPGERITVYKLYIALLEVNFLKGMVLYKALDPAGIEY